MTEDLVQLTKKLVMYAKRWDTLQNVARNIKKLIKLLQGKMTYLKQILLMEVADLTIVIYLLVRSLRKI